jgi:predicted NAD-dependent protein-ADP-ribosyltransferase YbiA (DUF1768 family)
VKEQQEKRLFDEIPFDANRPYEQGGWRNLPEIVHDEHNIKGFFGEYRWLSNFGQAQVQLDGVVYPSVEIAYQAAKQAPQDREYFLNCTSKESIAYNRDNQPGFYTLEIWDTVKTEIMRFLLEQKFDPESNPDNTQRLIETGNRYIEETNWWGDEFWGKNLKGEGLNTLGILIMEIRERYTHHVGL